MVSRHPAKFGVHEHCGSRDLFLVIEEDIPQEIRFSSPSLFISKEDGMKANDMSCTVLFKQVQINKLEKYTQETFVNPSRNAVEKKKEQKKKTKAAAKRFTLTSKCNNNFVSQKNENSWGSQVNAFKILHSQFFNQIITSFLTNVLNGTNSNHPDRFYYKRHNNT